MPRFLTLLLAVILMTGVASAASGPDSHPGSAAVLDSPDSLELDPAITVRPLALPAPIAEVVSRFAPVLQPATGRLHAVLVFRPPR